MRKKRIYLEKSDYLMNRRDFLGSSLAALTLTCGALTLTLGGSSNSVVADYIFYDERFQTAEHLAQQLAGSGEVIPVRGDITHVWNRVLKSNSQRLPLMLVGVTTESFYFCLKTLMRSHTGLTLSTNRMSQDLIAWSIRSHQPNKRGIS
jgi:hypothetical protein